jgi:hypothetical protein
MSTARSDASSARWNLRAGDATIGGVPLSLLHSQGTIYLM